jgi:hypothetical protein
MSAKPARDVGRKLDCVSALLYLVLFWVLGFSLCAHADLCSRF